MIDCHVHTARCGHGEGEAAAYVDVARERGIDVIAFTEHMPLPPALDPRHEYSMPEDELASYLDEVHALAASGGAAREGPLVLAGLEADWLPGYPGRIERLLSRGGLDVVLGSVHFLDEWAFDDPRLAEHWEMVDVDAVWERYFGLVMDAAESGLFDVMAHPDLVKKFGHRPSFDPRELYEAAARSFATAGTAIEVSTAGLRKPVDELYPAQGFLEACSRAGVPATVGSDAHAPSEVGFRLDAARAALLSAGYDHVVYFVGREPKEHPL